MKTAFLRRLPAVTIHSLIGACLGLGISGSLMAGEAPADDPYTALHDAIMIRKGTGDKIYGADEPSPLFWGISRHLLPGDIHRALSEGLVAFGALSSDEIDAISPIRRALLQRHLWAVFDWSAGRYFEYNPGIETAEERANRLAIQERAADLIWRVALSREEIEALPDPLAATVKSGEFAPEHDPDAPLKPFLPPGLASPKGDWVSLRKTSQILAADQHTEIAGWRTAFEVRMRLPEGRKQTLDYLEKLGKFKQPWIYNGFRYHHNPETPQIPVGTQVALVQRALLIDTTGQMVPSPLILGAELRAYLNIELQMPESKTPAQALAEFVVQPRELMAGNPAMKAIGATDYHFSSVIDQGSSFAAFLRQEAGERENLAAPSRLRPHFQNCRNCHSAPGIQSINSRVVPFDSQPPLIPAIFRETADSDEIADATIRAKQRDRTWGLLQGLWRP